MQNAKQKEAVKEDDEETIDEDYTLKFIDDYACKPMNNGFEDIKGLKAEMNELKTQLQKIREQNETLMGLEKKNVMHTDVQFKSALRYLYAAIWNIIPILEVPTEI
ncbi:hypothetical protein E5676_scaffold108G00540 [Cucumis melo var. makuwa]|uniref:Uncharacterized protein n=1 Tax=Cucumis melo var. makuwa TaxID=1194695 RepID=A0A5A7URK6_CUCMM|nr:hypothetical protein E6C27_scaffold226G00220 [Cucumis melo var. makuwa]TYK05244.1 hypothetical protein E5676_scaffold108G00540 [Cucumis melo var. makuwa]